MLIQDQETSSLLETKFELMLNMSSQKLRKEIDELKQQVASLSGELETIKKSQARPTKNEEYQATLAKQFEQSPQPRSEQPVQQPAQGTQPRSRTGNTNPEDVSIEKMFYFGGRR